jgi:hypothetical protein
MRRRSLELRRLKAANQDQTAGHLAPQGGLATYEASDNDERGIKDSKIAQGPAQRAEGALRRAGRHDSIVAGGGGCRQRAAGASGCLLHGGDAPAGSGTVPTTGPARRSAAEPSKRPLVERINDPRLARLVRAVGAQEDTSEKRSPRRVSGFLKALDGDSTPAQADADKAAAAAEPATEQKVAAAEAKPSRRARLLERITGLDKTSA